MPLLVRKISKAKWYQIDIENNNDVKADAVTNCLKTTKNSLSVWRIESEDDLDEAVLALVSNQDHLDTIDVVILEESTLIGYKLNIVASPGDTPVESLIEAHRDIADLTFTNLGLVKDHIVERIRKHKIKRYTIGSLKKLLKVAIEKGMLNKTGLKESVQNKI
ncbi:MAG: hypothetical protein EA412_01200 [Chitinophagaceae bacterium]|nr:MAG: hypothetical protein EA412_01200 [Chitinophagaceae bacterium]